MYLEHAQAFVSFSTKPQSEGKPQLDCRAWLSCPHCRYVVESIGPVTTLQLEKERMSQVMRREVTDFTPNMLSGIIHQQMAVLKRARTCTECGIISALTARDTAKAEKALARLVTAEWLNAQIDSLMMCVTYRNRLALETSPQ
jgi:hypothetical protein